MPTSAVSTTATSTVESASTASATAVESTAATAAEFTAHASGRLDGADGWGRAYGAGAAEGRHWPGAAVNARLSETFTRLRESGGRRRRSVDGTAGESRRGHRRYWNGPPQR